jgi:hypothetical protein
MVVEEKFIGGYSVRPCSALRCLCSRRAVSRGCDWRTCSVCTGLRARAACVCVSSCTCSFRSPLQPCLDGVRCAPACSLRPPCGTDSRPASGWLGGPVRLLHAVVCRRHFLPDPPYVPGPGDPSPLSFPVPHPSTCVGPRVLLDAVPRSSVLHPAPTTQWRRPFTVSKSPPPHAHAAVAAPPPAHTPCPYTRTRRAARVCGQGRPLERREGSLRGCVRRVPHDGPQPHDHRVHPHVRGVHCVFQLFRYGCAAPLEELKDWTVLFCCSVCFSWVLLLQFTCACTTVHGTVYVRLRGHGTTRLDVVTRLLLPCAVPGISITKHLNAATRMVLDSTRTIIVWAFSLALNWEKFCYVQVLECVLLGCFRCGVGGELVGEAGVGRRLLAVGSPPCCASDMRGLVSLTLPHSCLCPPPPPKHPPPRDPRTDLGVLGAALRHGCVQRDRLHPWAHGEEGRRQGRDHGGCAGRTGSRAATCVGGGFVLFGRGLLPRVVGSALSPPLPFRTAPTCIGARRRGRIAHPPSHCACISPSPPSPRPRCLWAFPRGLYPPPPPQKLLGDEDAESPSIQTIDTLMTPSMGKVTAVHAR